MLTIGEFSKIARISSRMLRHYDSINLLKPIHIDDQSNYRYYEISQLKLVSQIDNLKNYGFSLSEIKKLISLSDRDLSEAIRIKVISQYENLNHLRKTIKEMENKIFKFEGYEYLMEKYKVIVLKNKPQKIFGIRKTINIGQVGELFDELLEEMKNKGIERSGVCQMAYLGEEFSYHNMDVEAQVEVFGNSPFIKEIPETTYVTTIHNGSYENLKNAYDAISVWFSENPEYKVIGSSIERYLKDVDMVTSQEELETAILFPVIKD